MNLDVKAQANAFAGRVANAFAKFKNTLAENWQSGLEGKIFLVAAGLLSAWAVAPFFGSASDDGAEEKNPQALFATPTEVLRQYYKSFMSGDIASYVNCVDYSDEQKAELVKELENAWSSDDWQRNISQLYGKVTFGVPSWDGEGKMSIKVEIENAADGGSNTKNWYLSRTGRGWLINPENTTNPDEMGL